MYKVNDIILDRYASDDRQIYVRATFNDTYKINGEYIKTFTVTNSVSTGNDSLSLGNTYSNKLELNMYVPDSSGYTYTDDATGETTTYNDFTGIAAAKIFLETGVSTFVTDTKTGDGTTKTFALRKKYGGNLSVIVDNIITDEYTYDSSENKITFNEPPASSAEITLIYLNQAEFTPIGVFYVDSYESKDDFKSVSITAFDGMLKIDNVLGSSYTCGITNTQQPTALNVIKDILSQAGISSSYIGNSSTVNPLTISVRDAEGVMYDTTGEMTQSSSAVGFTDMVYIPTVLSDDSVEIDIFNNDEVFPDSINVMYFNDKEGTDLSSYVVKENIDTGLYIEDETYGTGIVVNLTLPSRSAPLYMAIGGDTGADNTYKNTTILVIRRGTNVTNYINFTAKIPHPHKVDISARTVLGYMAGILGANAFFDREGHFRLRCLNQGEDIFIEQTEQYMDGFQKARESALTVGYVTTGSEPNAEGQGGIITVGSGTFGFNFENPYVSLISASSLSDITSTQAVTNIKDLYNNMSFVTGEIRYRYNPSIDAGDMVKIENEDGTYTNVLALGQRISMTGGLSATIECNISTDMDKDFVSTPTSQKISQKMNDFVKNYQDIVKVLTGVTGGYVKFVYDSSNNFRAIAITQSDIELTWDETNNTVVPVDPQATTVPMWIWSYGGLRFTNDNGASYAPDVAINMNGQIYANYLLSPSGMIGGWSLTNTQIHSSKELVEDSGIVYTTRLCSIDYGGDDPDPHNHALLTVSKNDNGTITWPFVLRYDGSLSASDARLSGGTIAGWTIDSESMYADYGNYRAYIQKPLSSTHWVFSTQQKSGSSYVGKFYVQADGKVVCRNGLTANTLSSTYITVDNDITVKGGILLNSSDSNYHLCYSSGKVLLGGGEHAVQIDSGNYAIHFYAGTTIQCHSDLKLNFSAVSGAAPLYVNTSGVVTASSSSKRYKENITDVIPENLNPENLYDLPVSVYNYKDEFKDKELVLGEQIGIIAEDVEKHYPVALIRNDKGEAESWQDRIMIPAMLKLIQDQKSEIDDLKERVSKLEDLINKLTKE